MCAKFKGIPAAIYSGLWKLKIFGKLNKAFPDTPIRLIIYVTDHPPAILIKINERDFEIIELEEVKEVKDLERFECEGYLAAPMSYILKGPGALMKGKNDGEVNMKNESRIFLILGKIISLLG